MAYDYAPEIIKEKNFLTRVPIFTWYNEKSAVFNLYLSQSGELAISIAPSNLRGKNIGKQQVVEKGTKIYDYSNEAYSNLTYQDAVQLRDYMKAKIDSESPMMMNSMYALLVNAAATNPQLNDAVNYAKYLLDKYNSDHTFDKGITFFRLKNTKVPKQWNFNFTVSPDGSRELMYVSVVRNNNKDDKIYTSMSKASYIPFYNMLNSYVNNASNIIFTASLLNYEDNELQVVKVAMFKQLLTSIYGENFERCSNPTDKTNMVNIHNTISQALMASMMASKNFRQFTGGNQHKYSNDNNNDKYNSYSMSNDYE